MWIALIVIGVAMIVTALVLTPQRGATATTDPCPPRWRPESCWARTPTSRRLRHIVRAPLRRPRIGARRADPVIADLAVVFPGQGTQFPGMGRPWEATPAWATVVGPAEEALEEDLGHLLLEAGEDELGRTRNAQLAVLLTSLLVWESLRDRVRPVRVRRSFARPGDRADRRGRAAVRRRCPVRGDAGRADPGGRRRDAGSHGGAHRCDARAGAPGLRRGVRDVLDRERQRPGAGRDRRDPGRPGGGRGGGQGGRCAHRPDPRRRWCVPHPPDAARGGCARRCPRRYGPSGTRGAGRVQRRRPRRDRPGSLAARSRRATSRPRSSGGRRSSRWYASGRGP